jgi:hypothetical protein
MRRVVIEEFFKVYRETRRANCQAFAGTPHPGHISPGATVAIPACIRLLGTPWPCGKHEVQQAFRQLVKVMHPDGGGTNESFHRLYKAYQEALALLPKR